MNARRGSGRRPRQKTTQDATASQPRSHGIWRTLAVLSGAVLVVVVIAVTLWPRRDGEAGRFSRIREAGTDENLASIAADGRTDSPAAPLDPATLPDPSDLEEWKLETLRVAAQLAEDLPDHSDAVQVSAMIHWAMGDMLEAERLSRKCLTLDQRSPLAYEGLGRVHLLRGEFDQAITMFRRAIQLDPHNRQRVALLGEALVGANRMEELVAEYTRLIGTGPVPPTIFLTLGQAYLDLEQYEQAQQALETAAEYLPEDRQVHFALNQVYEATGQAEKATRQRERIQQLVEVYRHSGEGRVRAACLPDRLFDDVVRAHQDAAAIYAKYDRSQQANLLLQKADVLNSAEGKSPQSSTGMDRGVPRSGDAAPVVAGTPENGSP
jgi:tetratricopeptide (TPR) repeat protein